MPPDACYIELMRFRVRPPKNRELPLQVKTKVVIDGKKVEIFSEILVPGFSGRKLGQVKSYLTLWLSVNSMILVYTIELVRTKIAYFNFVSNFIIRLYLLKNKMKTKYLQYYLCKYFVLIP